MSLKTYLNSPFGLFHDLELQMTSLKGNLAGQQEDFNLPDATILLSGPSGGYRARLKSIGWSS